MAAETDEASVTLEPVRQIAQSVQREFEPVLHAQLLEQARHINLHRALRNAELVSDLLILETLREQRHQLAFAPRQRIAVRGHDAVRERLFEPEFTFVHAHQAADQSIHRQCAPE